MIRFLNKPIIDYIVLKLAKQGIEEFYIGVSGYTNYIQLLDHLGSGTWVSSKIHRDPDRIRIRYQPNVISTGNSESVMYIMEYYDIWENVVVAPCDVIIDLDLDNIAHFHDEKEAFMTIVLKEIEDPELLKYYGVAELEEYLIKRFIEKPKDPSEAPSRLVNTGIYILSGEFRDFFNSKIYRSMRENGETDFGKHIIPKLIELGYRVVGYVTKGYWFDIGTPETYMKASRYLIKVLSEDELEVDFVHGGLRMQGKKQISRKLQVETVRRMRLREIVIEGDVLIGRHVQIGGGVNIVNSIIDHFTIINNNAKIVDSIIMDRCNIGEGAVIMNSIIGRHCRIGRNTKITDSVIGNNVLIGENAIIDKSKIWPYKQIDSFSKIENLVIN